MRSFAFVPLVLACAVAPGAAAQSGEQPNLVLTIVGGAATGHSLWSVAKQPFAVLGTVPTQFDTFRLSRTISSSMVLGAAATYFPWPSVGFHAELSYLGLPADNSCVVLFSNPDAENKNQQVCDNIQAQQGFGGAIAVFGGVTLRAASRRAISPYVRGNVGVISLSRSTIEVAAGYIDGTGAHSRLVIADPDPRHTSLMIGAAAGFTTPVGTGYQFRFEVRDVITSLDRLTGPANALAIGPVDTRRYHHFALTLGFDVVLERRRGRRY